MNNINKFLLLLLLAIPYNLNAMEAPSAAKESASAAAEPSPEPKPETEESFNERFRKNTDDENGAAQKVFVKHVDTINQFDRPFLMYERHYHKPGSKNPEMEAEEAEIEGDLKGRASVAALKAQLRGQNTPEIKRLKQELSETDIDIALFKEQALRDKIPMERQAHNARRDARVKFAAQQEFQNLAIQEQLAQTEQAKKLAEQQAHIAAHKNNVFTTAQLNRDNFEIQRKLAEQKVELSIYQQELLRHGLPAAKQVEYAKEDARVKFAAQQELQTLAIQDQLAQTEQAKKLAAQKAELAFYQQDLLQDKTIANSQKAIAFARHQGITSATAQLEAKQLLRDKDPDQKYIGKTFLYFTDIASRDTAAIMWLAIKTGGSFVLSKAPHIYLKIPYVPFKENIRSYVTLMQQKQLQRLQQKYMKSQLEEIKREKIETQKALQDDAQLLEDQRKQIEYLNQMIETETNQEKKKALTDALTQLKDTYIQSVIQHNTYIALNLENQPHMQNLIQNFLHKKRQHFKKTTQEPATTTNE